MAKHKKINIDNVKIVMRDDSGMYAGCPELKPQKTEIDWVWECWRGKMNSRGNDADPTAGRFGIGITAYHNPDGSVRVTFQSLNRNVRRETIITYLREFLKREEQEFSAEFDSANASAA